MLALGIVTAHVADQGGITKLTDPAWIGWGYRLTEVGGLATVAVIVLLGRWRPVWAAPLLLGVGPMVAYLTSRTVGLPGDSQDVGNWGDWTGTMSLLFEAALVVLAGGLLRRDREVAGSGAVRAREGAPAPPRG
jgi:hypothetical protein